MAIKADWSKHGENLRIEYNELSKDKDKKNWTIEKDFVPYFNKKYNTEYTSTQVRHKLDNLRKRCKKETANRQHTGSTNIESVEPVIKEVFPDDYIAQNKVILDQQKKIKKMQVSEDIYIRTMSTEIKRLKPYNWDIKTPKKVKAKNKHSAQTHLLLSDIHDGVEIKLTDTMGLTAYTPEVCEQRFDLLADKMIQFHQSDQAAHGLNKLVITELGDTMEGTNVYPGQSFTVVMNELEQWTHSIELHCKFIIKMCKEFNEVEVFFVPGNHGWGGPKKGNSPQFLADSFLYKALYMLLKDIPNLKMYLSDCPRMMVRHGSRNFVYSHGNESRSSLGIPFYGLQRTAMRLPKLLGNLVDYYCHGHFHTASDLNDGEIIGNGCFPGGSDLSVNKMSVSSRPSQKQFYFSGNEIFNQSNIYLAPRAVLSVDEKNIYTPYNTDLERMDNCLGEITEMKK